MSKGMFYHTAALISSLARMELFLRITREMLNNMHRIAFKIEATLMEKKEFLSINSSPYGKEAKYFYINVT